MFSFKKASLSGAIDVIVIEHSDGMFMSTPFHVVFSKYKNLRNKSNQVRILVNGSETPVTMTVGKKGKASFARTESSESSEVAIDRGTEKMAELLLQNRKTVEMSICGTSELSRESFNQKLIPIDMLKSSPVGILKNPNLLLRINNNILCLEEALSQLPEQPQSKYKRYTPTMQEILELNLTPGKNIIDYRFGAVSVIAQVYLWREDSKLVISDIDGTITKSDFRGHLFTALGIKWSHEHVTELYQSIVARGYKLVYLSSRAIGLIDSTKSFLQKLQQNDVHLPEGPVLIAPTNFWTSIVRETISKKSYELKTSILLQIKHVFPFDLNPFYAGFGNRDTDTSSYREMQMPHVFTINKNSEILNSDSEKIGNYGELLLQIDALFPEVISPTQ